MAFGLVSLEKRLKENIKNYSFDQLFSLDEITDFLKVLAQCSGCSFLLTDRHGEKGVCAGELFMPGKVDVMANPGEKVRIAGRTIAHLYMKVNGEESEETRKLLEEAKLPTAFLKFVQVPNLQVTVFLVLAFAQLKSALLP